ncbi:hypothetical protein B0T18DRAFT_424650 [Schizothecium vesticola]|uniref:PinX1-related protein 1 n=1 Tax=Schizothecium vesticola TaxID=314040 RepID=A0AA40FAG0_9PEZI|nr:hypothetical protein B0T18DRAFT_424650 [Schizothecium vesticola]
MGLAGAKNKRKLGNDPNNTKWSRNTETYGQRMLRSQGWEPGKFLGAEGAAHAEWHTEASSTHIKVTLKDDNLGLGAKRNNGDECTGLDAFQSLLGRLNGKAEDVLAAEEKHREEVKLNRYVELKLGRIRFVSGGFLVGDKLEIPAVEETPAETSTDESSSSEAATESKKATKSSKKRKAEGESAGDEKRAKKKEKKEKKEKRARKQKDDSDVEMEDEPPAPRTKEKKSKKRGAVVEEDATGSDAESSSDEVAVPESRKERKERKRQEKQEKKDKKKRRKESPGSAAEEGEDATRKKKKRKEKEGDAVPDPEASSLPSGTSTPTGNGSGVSTPLLGSNRFMSRQRFIAQKKMAFADTAALNQIFMIKS